MDGGMRDGGRRDGRMEGWRARSRRLLLLCSSECRSLLLSSRTAPSACLPTNTAGPPPGFAAMRHLHSPTRNPLVRPSPPLPPQSHALPSAAPAWDGPSAPPSNPRACGCSHLHRCVPHPWVQGTRLGPETVPEHPGLVLDLVLLWFLSPRVWYPDSQTQSPVLVPIQNRSDPGCFSAWS